MKNPLVSIIIPTYNRGHIISETLDSIIAQTYTNWECIVVDDRSIDNTDLILNEYVKKDSRIKYHHRPKNRLKGGNAARNYGFELSSGEYVNWFDSDDLMLPNLIEDKLSLLLSQSNIDFIVSRGKNFYEDGSSKDIRINHNLKEELNHNNFILGKVFWITNDFFCNKNAVSNIRFDDELQSGHEYLFFIKAMAVNNLKGFFLNKILVYRRIHRNSIQQTLNNFKIKNTQTNATTYLHTYVDVKHLLNNEAKKTLFRQFTTFNYETVKHGLKINLSLLIKTFFREKKLLKTILYSTSLLLAFLFKKGYSLMNFSRN